jgi:hypothetical protein
LSAAISVMFNMYYSDRVLVMSEAFHESQNGHHERVT